MTARLWEILERAWGSGGVLAYHGIGPAPPLPSMHITPHALRDQLAFARELYEIISLTEMLAGWARGRAMSGCVAITFDDAYAGVAEFAAPILRELDLPATVFVTTRAAERGSSYWWDTAEVHRGRSDEAWQSLLMQVGLQSLAPEDPRSFQVLRDRVLTRYKGRAPWNEEMEGSLRTSPWRSLTFNELGRLARDARFDFGCHTLSHPALPFLSAAEQEDEIRASWHDLDERLPRVRPIIAYPYGLYDRSVVRTARTLGMQAGVTMEGRAPATQPDPFLVPRIGVGDVHSTRSIRLRLNRALRVALIVRNRGPHPRLPRDPAATAAPTERLSRRQD